LRQCDWTRADTQTAEGKASDAVAVMLSVIPGLGHIYKGTGSSAPSLCLPPHHGHWRILLAANATAGFALLLLPLYWFGVMFHVWGIEDRVVPPERDEGEQY